MKIKSSIVHGKSECLTINQVIKAEGEIFVCLDGGDLVYINKRYKLFLWLNVCGELIPEDWSQVTYNYNNHKFRKFSGTLTLEFTSE